MPCWPCGLEALVVPTPATAEFRVPGLFGGKKVVKRKRYRRAAPVQPVRNPDRTFAAVSAKVATPDIAKNSVAALSVGTTSTAIARLALPAPSDVADVVDDTDKRDDQDKKTPKTASEGASSKESDEENIKTAKNDEVDADETDAEEEDKASADPSDTDDAEGQNQAAVDVSAASDAQDKTEKVASDEVSKDSESSTAQTAQSDEEQDEDQERAIAADEKTDSNVDEIETAASKASVDGAADSKDAAPKADAGEKADQKTASEQKTADDKDSDEPTAEDKSTKKPVTKSAEVTTQDDDKAASAGTTDDAEKDVADTSKTAETVEEDSETASRSAKPATDTKSTADTNETAAKGSAKEEETAEADRRPDAAKDDPAKEEIAEDKRFPKTQTKRRSPTKGKNPAEKAEATDDKAETHKCRGCPPPVPDQKPTGARKPGAAAGLAEADDAKDGGESATDATTGNAAAADSRVHDAIVVLDISPPPSEKTEVDDTKVAAVAPALRPSLTGTSEGKLKDEETADRASSRSGAKRDDKDEKTAAIPEDVELSAGRDVSDGGADNVSLELGPPPPPPVGPVIAAVRSKLEKAAPNIAAADLEALKTVYGERDDDPLWVAEDGFAQNAKTLITTIGDADDWGLDADAYAVPAPNKVLTTDEARADAEVALSAAVLKYARHAQTGRLTPSKAHKLFDFNPTARDPKKVLIEIAESKTPDKVLLALHPQHQQYQTLHVALVQARDSAKGLGKNPDDDRMVQLIAINMERWRWLPSDLGSFHVWNNIPEFNFRVVKGGREIYKAITIVGQTKYATAFFSAPMRNIVFNPNWTVPPTIVKEDIAPKLKGPQRSGGLFGGRESRNRMLRRYGLKVSRGGKPIDADAVNWQTANVHTYTFQQDPALTTCLVNSNSTSRTGTPSTCTIRHRRSYSGAKFER